MCVCVYVCVIVCLCVYVCVHKELRIIFYLHQNVI